MHQSSGKLNPKVAILILAVVVFGVLAGQTLLDAPQADEANPSSASVLQPDLESTSESKPTTAPEPTPVEDQEEGAEYYAIIPGFE